MTDQFSAAGKATAASRAYPRRDPRRSIEAAQLRENGLHEVDLSTVETLHGPEYQGSSKPYDEQRHRLEPDEVYIYFPTGGKTVRHRTSNWRLELAHSGLVLAALDPNNPTGKYQYWIFSHGTWGEVSKDFAYRMRNQGNRKHEAKNLDAVTKAAYQTLAIMLLWGGNNAYEALRNHPKGESMRKWIHNMLGFAKDNVRASGFMEHLNEAKREIIARRKVFLDEHSK